MVVIPRWARAKMARRKRPYNGKNYQNVNTNQARMLTMSWKDEFGNTVLYRDHNRSQGVVDPNALIEGKNSIITKQFHRITTEHKYLGYPAPVIAFLDEFEQVPDASLPPMIAVMRQRKELWQGVRRQGKDHHYCITVCSGSIRHIVCFLSAKTAYFVWINNTERTAQKSSVVGIELAKHIIDRHNAGAIIIERVIQWAEFVNIPSPVTS